MRNIEYDKFIDLNRSFHKLSNWATEDDNHDLTQNYSTGSTIYWPSLLANYRTIILSEAGSGKTAEIMHQAKTLEKAGKPSFFMRLENVAHDFDIAFEVGTPDSFNIWLNSLEEGWVFLDSVDEARLKSPTDFQLAIRHVGRRLMKALDRTHVIITGRSSAWRPRSDRMLCDEHFPIAHSKRHASQVNDDTPATSGSEQKEHISDHEFLIVTLDSLSDDQISIFLHESRVADIKGFRRAVERADAASATLRPQDLVEVIAFWNKHSRIGNRYELMQFSITQRLTERDPNRAEARPLTADKVRRAAKLLAATATLSKIQSILLPDHEPGLSGVQLDTVLPEWTPSDQSALLSRPIFDDAIYGSVRFYHRIVREYLTAEWINDLLQKQTSRRRIYQLLFRRQYGLNVISPTMRPVLSWLILLDNEVLTRTLSISPEIALEGGDPSRLPVDIRRKILSDICQRAADGKPGRSIYDYGAVQRFASNDIGNDVSLLLEKYRRHGDICWLLLRMVWIGEITICLPIAKTIALDHKTEIYARIAAFKAVAAVGKDSDQVELREKFLTARGSLRRDWIGELLSHAPHTPEVIDWVSKCMNRTSEKRRYSPDSLENDLSTWVAAAPEFFLIEIISALGPFLSRKPVEERRYCELSKRFSWLMKPLCKAVERLVSARNSDALEAACLDILHKIPAAKAYDIEISESDRPNIRTSIESWPEINRALFWYSIGVAKRAAAREKPRRRITKPWEAATYNDLWCHDAADFPYFVSQIEQQQSLDDKLISLTAAVRLLGSNGARSEWKKQLQDASTGNPQLLARLELMLHPPPPSAEEVKWHRQEKTWKKQAQQRSLKQEKNKTEWREQLRKIPDKIRNPRFPNPEDISRPQWYLLQILREKADRSSRWSDGRWELLIEEFGTEVAEAFRDGAVAYWRHHDPKIRSEGAPSNTTTGRVVFGLTGLEIEALIDPDWATKLSASEAWRACRYASHEMNGFPLWLPKLFENFPQEVAKFTLQEIRYELRNTKSNEEMHYLLSDVSWSGEWLWDSVAPSLFQTLQKSEPRSLSSLEKVLKIIQGASTVSDRELADLSCQKARRSRRSEHAAKWFAVWTGVNPEQAISKLKIRLAKFTDDGDATRFAMIYVQSLVGGRSSKVPKTRLRFHKPNFLKDLYILMHTYIRRSEDIDRTGTGGYSPELRDDAQDARNSLFALLNEMPGKDAFIAVDEISRVHPDEASRTFMSQHALSKAQADADLVPWTAKDVLVFNEHLECTPTDHRGLAELVVSRLLDMKDELEEGDTSLAKFLLGPSLNETDLRLYFGREFRDKSNGRYVAPQEEELADAKRPDIRLHGYGFDAPVPVELKLADNWSGSELFERFRNQLAGDYLRDGRSSRGVFLLVWRGKQKSWHIPGQKRPVCFFELIETLQQYWNIISPEHPQVDELTVIGIDLTRRDQASKAPIHAKLTA